MGVNLAPLLVLTGGGYSSVFTAGQLHALALLLLTLEKQLFNIYLVIFGFWLVLTGYLMFRSVFLPRFLGVLIVLAGLSYLILLSPPLANSLSPYYKVAPTPLACEATKDGRGGQFHVGIDTVGER